MDERIYKTKDFDELSWHDNKIHAITFDEQKFELLLDIDFIVEWVTDKKKWKFMVAPATLVFKEVFALNIDTDSLRFVIDVIEREEVGKPANAEYIEEQIEYEWQIIMTDGEIIFKSVGFQMFLRAAPTKMNRQQFELAERGGISFDRQ